AKRTAKCVALSNCDLCVLNSMDLKMVMKDFPTSAQTLQLPPSLC
ncbi:cyclic nucleotide-binding domain-containing protein, partial [Haematococcus lacustris]